MNKIIVKNTASALLFLLSASLACAQEQQIQEKQTESVTIDSAGIVTCSVTIEEAESVVTNFRKQQQKELSLIETVGWFMGPPKLEILMREDRLNKTILDYKKGKSAPDVKCPLDYIPGAVDKYTETSQQSIKAINSAESRKDSIMAKTKCYDLNKLDCAYPVFKAYKEAMN